MDRTYLSGLIAGHYAQLIAAAGATSADSVAGYGPALDSVMRQLNLATAATDPNPTIPAGSQEWDAVLLTRYYALDWLLMAAAPGVDVTTSREKEARSQLGKAIQALVDRARKQVPSQYAIEQDDFARGRLQLDFLEPLNQPSTNPLYPYP